MFQCYHDAIVKKQNYSLQEGATLNQHRVFEANYTNTLHELNHFAHLEWVLGLS